MKKILLTILIELVFLFSISAQVEEKGKPESFSKSELKTISELNSLIVPSIDISNLIDEDLKNNVTNRYSVYKNYYIDIKKHATKTVLDNGTIWRYKVSSKNALSLSIIFDSFYLPEGAKLFLYNSNKKQVRGAFTSKNNKEGKVLALADFIGNELILEYFEPFTVEFSGEVIIGKIGSAYREINGIHFKSTEQADINVTCDEGKYYQTEKHAVAKMTYNIGTGGYLCTGALINTTRNNGAPYFLTANHCLSGSAPASTLVTYFNYERENCNGFTSEPQTLSGSILKATNPISDFTLLYLSESPPDDYRPYYAGWDATESDNFLGGYGIHHPGGKVKKIALTYDSITSWGSEISWENPDDPENPDISEPNTHWLVLFNAGFTEGGSSGSPIFNSEDRIIGQLHGGSSVANFYGKINTSWDAHTQSVGKLQPHLDPDNTGVLVLDAYYPSTIIPEPFLYTDFQNVCQGEAVVIKDGSAFDVIDYNWSFYPSTVQFLNGTDNTSQEPVVSFDEATKYDIILKVSNSNGADSSERSNYIVSGSGLQPVIKAMDDTLSCYDYFESLRFYATGADSFQWSILSNAEHIDYEISSSSDTLVIMKKAGVNPANTIYIDIQLKGFHGACSDSAVQTVQLIVPENDYINNATPLVMGSNGFFYNYCATVEENEPHPPIGDCSTIGEWCDCEIGGPYVDNSVWFTFVGPESGVVAIDCPGFDNQIAVYESESADNIMSGNPNLYTIISAMDDYYGEEGDYAARINHIDVTPGTKYWLQVDGSACGAAGEFEVILSDTTLPSLNNADNIANFKSIQIFPNPASNHFSVSGDIYNLKSVELISIDGRVLKQYNVRNYSAGEQTFELPSGITSGVYLVRFVEKDGFKTYILTINK
jgi:hypothetical protein